jgi:hypothetical protein
MTTRNLRHLIRRASISLTEAFYGIVVAGLAIGVVITWVLSATLTGSLSARR